MNTSSLAILECLALRVRIATALMLAQMVRLSDCRALQLLRSLKSDGLVADHRVWSVSPLPSSAGPLFIWDSGQELDLDAVREAARIGIRRWENLRPCVVRAWNATTKGCRRFGVREGRMSRGSEVPHDLFFASVVAQMDAATRDSTLREEAFGAQYPIARALHADAVVAGRVAETVGKKYTTEDLVDFANACRERACGFALY